MQIFMVVLHSIQEMIQLDFMNIHNQIKQLSDRELLEGIYQMLLVVMQEQLVSDSKQLGINVIADLLVDNWYAQDSFSIYGQPGITAYNFRNTGGVTYLDGILNEAEVSNNLLNKKQIVTIVNPTDGGNNSIIFFNSYGSSYMNMAFYGSIGFDSVPTKQNDGFTEQDLINYVLENLITQ